MTYQAVLDFWFSPQNKPFWFSKNEDFDQRIRRDFLDLWLSACNGELFPWRKTVKGRLAEILLLDQFSRNLNRESALSYRQDGMALILSQELIQIKEWQELTDDEKAVSLLPWMHSESLVIHQDAITLFSTLSDASFLKFEIKHRDVIQRFGRYPHRNAVSGRASTPEEMEWMKLNKGF